MTTTIHVKSRAICILGMHRSGTSTITRAINLVGAYLGQEEDMMSPLPYNPEGFWERKDVNALLERILFTFRRKWDAIAPLPYNWHLLDEIRPFKEELRELIKKNFSGKTLWAWKDPRTCILFPLWKIVLEELHIELSCVFAVRNPLDVANSLKKRDGFSLEKSYGIWFNHNIVALQSIAGIPTVFLSYDSFLEGWEPELRRCTKVLGIDWPADDVPLREAMNFFIRPNLRHSLSTTNDLLTAPIPVRELYLPLLEQCGLSTPIDASLTNLIERLTLEFYSYASFFQSDQDKLFETELRLSQSCQQLHNVNLKFIERDQQLIERDQQLTELDQQLTELDQQLTELDQQLTSKDQQLTSKDQQLVEMELHLQAVLNSLSWKVTAPLRKVLNILIK